MIEFLLSIWLLLGLSFWINRLVKDIRNPLGLRPDYTTAILGLPVCLIVGPFFWPLVLARWLNREFGC